MINCDSSHLILSLTQVGKELMGVGGKYGSREYVFILRKLPYLSPVFPFTIRVY